MTGLLGFNPSNAGRWMGCGGSVALSQTALAQESEDTEAKLEGIAAHWVAEQLHAGATVGVGSSAPNGTTVTEEMLDAAKEYVSLLPDGTQLEVPVTLDVITPGMRGVVDAVAYLPGERAVIDIWDFKYGHSFVDEFENWQMLVEAAGLQGLQSATLLRFHVVQPRCYQAQTHRMWEITVEQYFNGYLPDIRETAATIVTGSAGVHTGAHCKHCPAAGDCDALALVGYDIIDRMQEASSAELTPLQLALELRALHTAQDRLKARLSGLEENASAVIRNGGRVPGYTLTPQAANLAWTSPHETVIAMAKLAGADVRKPTVAITPTQAIKAGMSEAMVNAMSARPPKPAKLTQVKSNQAKKVFKK